MSSLADKDCRPCPKGTPPLADTQARRLLEEVPGWSLDDEIKRLSRTFRFGNFHETMAFVNAVAWIAHQTDHHPDLQIGYNRCHIDYSTHSIGGLSENDFICAARINALGSL
jgi:4a-hydroxytetrahydrobiopterin dehydratase